MFRSYLKIAWRNIFLHKAYSFINIAGLGIGIAACLLLFIIINFELSYDNYHVKANRIFRIVTKNTYSDGVNYEEGITNPATEALRIDFSQIEKISEVFTNYGGQITVPSNTSNRAADSRKYTELKGMLFIDPEFFGIFECKWLSGNPGVLANPNSVVIDKTHATRYFGDWKNAMGKTLVMDNALMLKVSGVIDDSPPNTDLPLQVMVSFITLKHNANLYGFQSDWAANVSNHQVYILLPRQVTPASIDGLLKGFVAKHFDKDMMANMKKAYFLQPLADIHFDKRFGNLGDHEISKITIWTLSLIGLFILVMACINFINLATAQAVGRSREVGIRKVLGGSRLQLIFQGLGETMLIVGLGLILAILIGKVAFPYLKNVTQIPEQIRLLNGSSLLFLLVTAIVVTFISGLYPALISSGFKPATALKNKISSARMGGISVRRLLVIVQFSISQVLIIGTIVAVTQMKSIRNADLGFNKDAVLILDNINDSAGLQKMSSLKAELKQIPSVRNVSFNASAPSSDNTWGNNFYFDHSNKELGYETTIKQADQDYFQTFGLRFLAGRPYVASDTLKEVVINETLMKKLGILYPSQAIGKTIRIGARNIWCPIVGVVQDFKTNSLREETRPVVLFSRKKYYGRIGVKIEPNQISKTMAAIQTVWQKYFPDYVYEPAFLDERIAAFYKQENQIESLYKIFSVLAIFISCLGLYGLVSFMALQKTKEVGVRKVLGASVGSIVYLFSKEFTMLILIAFLIATPIAYYFALNWLQNFAYRITLGPQYFIATILCSLSIAWITVGYKALRSALANPIRSLRSE
jgi:putative ABC transport system permease protein